MTRVVRSIALAFLFVAGRALASDTCESILTTPPRDPRSAECFRLPRTLAERADRERQLSEWLTREPENPWLLAALGSLRLSGHPTSVRPPLERALQLFVATGARTGEGYARLLIARDAQRHRDLEELQRQMRAVAPIVAAANDPVLSAWLAFIDSSEFAFAASNEEAFLIALKVVQAEWFEALPRSLRYSLLGDVADEASSVERHSAALAFALRAFEACGDSPGCRLEHESRVANEMRKMAETGLATMAEAIRATRSAYESAKASGATWAELRAACELGTLTPPPESLTWNRLCGERATTLGCLDLRLYSQLNYAEGLARVDPSKLEDSIRTVERLRREQLRFPNTQEPTAGLPTLARLQRLAGRRAQAQATLEQALELREKQRDRESSPESRASVTSRSASDYYSLASYLVLEQDRPDIQGAFATMEALRGRTLADLHALESGAGPPQASGADVAELAHTVERIVAVQGQLADATLQNEERDFSLQELDRLETLEQELSARIARSNPQWAQARRPRSATLDDVRQRLAADEALVSLQFPPAVISDGWAVIVTADGARVVRLANFEAGSTLSLYLGAIEQRGDVPAVMAAAVEQGLLRPIIDALAPSIHRLVIVPDGPVAHLPIGALPDPHTGRPLIERFEISLAASATSWLALRTSHLGQLAPAALGLGDVTWSGGAAPDGTQRGFTLIDDQLALPRSRLEVQALVQAVGGDSRGLYAARASEASFKKLDLTPYGILHFATHAVVNASHPSRSAILLARGSNQEDGLLQPREIAALQLAGKLVFISACSSADGQELRGEGPLSLARAFLASGARAVIGTIWPVRDAEAAVLAQHFYTHLTRHETVAAALAGAQRDLNHAGAPPAAWAGFVLIGDGDVTLAERPRSTGTGRFAGTAWALALVAALAVAVVTWVFLHQR